MTRSTYSFLVTNTGNVTSRPRGRPSPTTLDCAAPAPRTPTVRHCPVTILAAGASTTCTAPTPRPRPTSTTAPSTTPPPPPGSTRPTTASPPTRQGHGRGRAGHRTDRGQGVDDHVDRHRRARSCPTRSRSPTTAPRPCTASPSPTRSPPRHRRPADRDHLPGHHPGPGRVDRPAPPTTRSARPIWTPAPASSPTPPPRTRPTRRTPDRLTAVAVHHPDRAARPSPWSRRPTRRR